MNSLMTTRRSDGQRRFGPAVPRERLLFALFFPLLLSMLFGCAASRPAPTVDEVREMQSRTVAMSPDEAFDGMIDVLQDFSFNVDSADPEAGLIVATRDSRTSLAQISRDERPDTTKKGLPVWAKAALVVTGVVVVAAVIAAVSDDDDDECTCERRDEKAAPCPRHRGQYDRSPGIHRERVGGEGHQVSDRDDGRKPDRDARDTHRKPRREPDRDSHRDHHPGHGHGPDVVIVHEPEPDVVIIHEPEPDYGPCIYHYRITVSLMALQEGSTYVRVSGQGTRTEGAAVREAGPILDPAFFGRLFSSLEERAAVRARPDAGVWQ